MAKYLVKFVDKKYLPNFQKLDNYTIRLGSFLDYKNTEDLKRQDKSEGQRGFTLTIKKPCSKLEEFILEGKLNIPEYTDKDLDKNGEFIPKVTILNHDYLNDFNAWMFCCSIVDSIDEIEEIKKKFNVDSYYFISDINKFANEIQRALVKSLADNPKINGQNRILYPKGENIYIDGFKNIITYENCSKYMNFDYNTLEEYLKSKDSRSLDKNLWFKKSELYKDEKEYRFIFYPTSGRKESKHYNINEESCLLDVNLSDCISGTPIDIE